MSSATAASIASNREIAMERDLEDGWCRVRDNLTELAVDDDTLRLVSKAYWYGVTIGVAVYSRAIDGVYR